jgi:hypothetical protein
MHRLFWLQWRQVLLPPWWGKKQKLGIMYQKHQQIQRRGAAMIRAVVAAIAMWAGLGCGQAFANNCSGNFVTANLIEFDLDILSEDLNSNASRKWPFLPLHEVSKAYCYFQFSDRRQCFWNIPFIRFYQDGIFGKYGLSDFGIAAIHEFIQKFISSEFLVKRDIKNTEFSGFNIGFNSNGGRTSEIFNVAFNGNSVARESFVAILPNRIRDYWVLGEFEPRPVFGEVSSFRRIGGVNSGTGGICSGVGCQASIAKRAPNKPGSNDSKNGLKGGNEQKPSGRIGAAFLGLKIASAIILVILYLAGLTESIHRVWTAASDAEFSAEPVNEIWVKALYGVGYFLLIFGSLLALPLLALLAWWIG